MLENIEDKEFTSGEKEKMLDQYISNQFTREEQQLHSNPFLREILKPKNKYKKKSTSESKKRMQEFSIREQQIQRRIEDLESETQKLQKVAAVLDREKTQTESSQKHFYLNFLSNMKKQHKKISFKKVLDY